MGTTSVSRARRRLFIGPVNSAGQGYRWARAAERLEGVAAADFMYRDSDDVFAFPSDHAVPTVFFRTNRPWQKAQRRALARRFTHVLIESGRQILGTTDSTEHQIAELRERGLHVGLLWHGSDIRTPSAHAAMEPDSPFVPGGYEDTAALEEIAARNHRLIERSHCRSFVSTPDLLTFVPDATWLPVVIEPDRWESAGAAAALTRRRPVVVHAPSNAGLKGSGLIAESMRRLDRTGVIEYRELRGQPAESMPGHYGAADIVLDQFVLGIYGVAACEALAAGRLVVSHVGDDVRDRVRAETGRELPIVESRAADLEHVIRGIVEDRERYVPATREGPAFVRAVHDGSRSAQVLGDFLGVTMGLSSRGRVED